MQNLFLLIIRYGGFLSFLGFEVICFFLIVNYNKNQQKIWIHSSNYVSGALYEKFDAVSRYWNLSVVADSLSQENARLRAELRDARFQEEVLGGSVTDQNWQQHYSFTSAEVVNNSVNRLNNYLTIDRGKRHGLDARMGVINDNGIVGIIGRVDNYYSSIMSVLNKETRIASSIKRNNFFGSVIWQNSNPTIAQLVDIPKHAPVAVGDTVQTSGYSAIFPGGIPIGAITEINLPAGSNFYNIDIKLFNDLSQVRYVYVINNLMKMDQKSVEEAKDE